MNVYPDGEKTDRLDTYLAAEDLDAVWFARPANFAWLTGGDNVVDREAEVGVAAAGYAGDEVRVVTDTIEAQRLAEEELPDGTPIESFPWYESTLPDAVAERSSTPAAADFDVPGLDTLDPVWLRVPLTDVDVERYRALGADTAAAVEAVGREV
ncbi:aminopeptidase P family N-terminal domain-containing protein, partial [Halococcus hamelinensis]